MENSPQSTCLKTTSERVLPDLLQGLISLQSQEARAPSHLELLWSSWTKKKKKKDHLHSEKLRSHSESQTGLELTMQPTAGLKVTAILLLLLSRVLGL